MIQPALGQYRFLKTYGEGLLAGLDPADAYTPVQPGGHHPAWILGHLTFSGLGAVQLLGGDASGFEEAQARFGIGSQPEAAPASDDFAAIRAGWNEAHARVETAVSNTGADRLAAPNPRERMAAAFPTIGDMVGFLLTGHEAVHLGQLSAWRRSRGADPLF